MSRRSLQELWRVLVSILGAGVLMAVGSMALFVTSAPRWLSAVVEPFSLLLVPGVAFSMLFTPAHDYTQWEILRGAFAFHVVVLYLLLRWWDGQKGLAQR